MMMTKSFFYGFCYECVERCGVSMCVLGGKEAYEFVVNVKCGYKCVGSCRLFMSVLRGAVWLCVWEVSVWLLVCEKEQCGYECM